MSHPCYFLILTGSLSNSNNNSNIITNRTFNSNCLLIRIFLNSLNYKTYHSSKIHLIRMKTLPRNHFELTGSDLYTWVVQNKSALYIYSEKYICTVFRQMNTLCVNKLLFTDRRFHYPWSICLFQLSQNQNRKKTIDWIRWPILLYQGSGYQVQINMDEQGE